MTCRIETFEHKTFILAKIFSSATECQYLLILVNNNYIFANLKTDSTGTLSELRKQGVILLKLAKMKHLQEARKSAYF